MEIDFVFIIDGLIKLGLIIFLSFIVGIEREFHSHPGGVITYMLVGIGSCLFTMISIDYNKRHEVSGDPMRVAAQIVSGMGFLGSATIYKSKKYVKGINSAASLWISAANGMAVGSGMLEYGIITSIFTMILLVINKFYRKYITDRRKPSNDIENQVNKSYEENEEDDEDTYHVDQDIY